MGRSGCKKDRRPRERVAEGVGLGQGGGGVGGER